MRMAALTLGGMKHSKPETRSQNLFDIYKSCLMPFWPGFIWCMDAAQCLVRRVPYDANPATTFERERKRRPNTGTLTFAQAGKAWR
jgi:hypothetical protein